VKNAHLALAIVVALGGTAVIARSAEAQAAPVASPFHAGQWGIDGYATSNAGGILRFFTPRTALVLDLFARHSSGSRDNGGGVAMDIRTDDVDIALGLRRHTMMAPRIAMTLGAGVEAGSQRQRTDVSGGVFPSTDYRMTHLGGYVDAGGQYMVADHFAIGLAYRLTARHTKFDYLDQSGSEFYASFLPIRATLYF
jgi:hypothetical protein